MRSGGMPMRATPGIQPASPTHPTAEAAQLAFAASLAGGSPSPWTMPTSSAGDICETSARSCASLSVPAAATRGAQTAMTTMTDSAARTGLRMRLSL